MQCLRQADVRARLRLTEKSIEKIQRRRRGKSAHPVYMVNLRNNSMKWRIALGYIWVGKGC